MFNYKKLLIIFIIIFFSVNLYPEKDMKYYNEKDPFVAGLLSATMLGLGQFYTKDYLKGSIFVFTDLLQKGMILYLISYLSSNYTDDDINDDVVEWKEVNNSDRAVILGFVVFYYGSRLYCIIDAMSGAKRYNENLKQEYSKKDVRFSPVISSHSFGVSLSKNF